MPSGPGKSSRVGISLVEMFDMFPDNATAENWFENVRWPSDKDRCCPKCGSRNTYRKANRKPQPFRCRDCRSFFSVRTGSIMECSAIPLRKWAIAIYLNATSLKGVSSMKLHRDLKITQKSAWFMAHRLRDAFASEKDLFVGPVEVDETYMGGKRKNMSNAKRKELKKAGLKQGPSGKVAVIGAKDRETNSIVARPLQSTDGETLKGFAEGVSQPEAQIYTDDAKAYRGMNRNHKSVNHSARQFVNGQAHTNGIESFWSMLKRGHDGTFHHMSVQHLHRYVNEFAGRHNIRHSDTIRQMQSIVAGMIGRRLMYSDLTGREAE